MGLSVPISQFQNDSAQLSLGKAGLFTETWPLQSAPAGVSSALVCIGPKEILPFGITAFVRPVLAQLRVGRETLFRLCTGGHGSIHPSLVQQQKIPTSITGCRETESHHDSAGTGSPRLQPKPCSKQGQHRPQPWAVVSQMSSRTEIPQPRGKHCLRFDYCHCKKIFPNIWSDYFLAACVHCRAASCDLNSLSPSSLQSPQRTWLILTFT